MNVSTPVIDRMFATKSTDATRLTEEELELLETAPYFEEFIIAKCGNLPPRTLGRPEQGAQRRLSNHSLGKNGSASRS